MIRALFQGVVVVEHLCVAKTRATEDILARRGATISVLGCT